MKHIDRRESFRHIGRLAGLSTAPRQSPGRAVAKRPVAPVEELVNVLEFEVEAARVLSPAVLAAIRGSDRRAFERMTFRQRLMVYAMDLDLTTELFGDDMFAPIVVGPVAGQQAFHPEGELDTVRGAAAAKTTTVISSRSSYPIDQIAAAGTAPIWYQAYADDGLLVVSDQIARAVGHGCRALCLTVGVASDRAASESIEWSQRLPTATDWNAVGRIRDTVTVPTVLHGVMTPEDAERAIGLGVDGIVVSNHGGIAGAGGVAPIEVLSSIADAVSARVPILIDGSFRRGTDILKGLALGARAALVGRPAMWGLAAYGGRGVQAVLELLQTELARNMAASGRPKIEMIDSSLVRWDSR